MKKLKTNISILLTFFLFAGVLLSCQNNKSKAQAQKVDQSTETENVSNNNFEGIIQYKYKVMGKAYAGKYFIKGDRIRIEHSTGTASIFLPEKSKSIALMNGEYMEIDIPKARKRLYWKTDGHATLKKTGETKTIAGHDCEVWVITDKENTYKCKLCMAKGLGNFVAKSSPLKTLLSPEMMAKIDGKDYMPLEVVFTQKGAEVMSMTAVNIEEKQLPDSLFQIPKGWKKIELKSPFK